MGPMTLDSSTQRIGRLTALSVVLSLIETRVGAAAQTKTPLTAARGFTLAEDVIGSARPPHAIALRDGFPVDSALVADAGSYMPIPLPLTTRRIDVGEPLPSGTDAVLPLDAVALRDHRAEAIAPAVAGEGVLAAAADVVEPAPLRRAGERVRAIDLAVMRAAGIGDVNLRLPKIHVVWGGDARSEPIEAALATIVRLAAEAGGVVTGKAVTLEPALGDPETDAVIAVGGTGSGRRDAAVATLARLGRVEVHGIAISPGETAAFGFIATRPVLLVPGRLDAALAVWLLIGRHLVARLAGGRVEDWSTTLPLKRKVTSTIGLAELVPVSCAGGMAEPLASGYLSLASLAESDGWTVVPADSEGFAEGTPVAVRPWP
ncbi:MAG TPA: molybdopterin-binding protein [Xanthobacteraceae bacterium]|nr:molybdopterin-binding protein [Xanthobacteraceae bacterium]